MSEEAAQAIVQTCEENTFVDYKLDFDGSDEHWLEFSKDVIAFANTLGGYLAFGVKNGSFEPIGANDTTVQLLSDPNNLMQKVNRHIEPNITTLRCKVVQLGSRKFVVVLIPQSLGQTHMIVKEGSFKHPSGVTKVILRQGTFYVRRSGANHLADARDLDAIVNRRIDYFRSSLLEKIARVVESPAETEVLIVRPEKGTGTKKSFVIENAPDAVAIKGMSFTVAPETPEQEVAAWIAIAGTNKSELPSAGTVWKWYSLRESMQLTPQQRLRVAVISILKRVPAFFWLRGQASEQIRLTLTEILGRRSELEVSTTCLAISAFFGKRFHKSQVSKLGVAAKRLGKVTTFPSVGPRAYFESALKVKLGGRPIVRSELIDALDKIVKTALSSYDGQPSLPDGWQAARLDCFLYAQDSYGQGKEEEDENSAGNSGQSK